MRIIIKGYSHKVIVIIFTILLYTRISYATSLVRLPIGQNERFQEILNLNSKISKILESNKTFEELLESEDFPYPLKNDGLNYTSFMLEAIKQVANKINSSHNGVRIERIAIYKYGSLARNRWMLGSDIDGMIIYIDSSTLQVDSPVLQEVKIWFSSVLERCGIPPERLNLDSEIEWKPIGTKETLDEDVLSHTIIYENGEILPHPITIPSGQKSGYWSAREKLFKYWSDGKLSEEEKAMLAELHKLAALRITSMKWRPFTVSEYEKEKRLKILQELNEKGLVLLLDSGGIVLRWLERDTFGQKRLLFFIQESHAVSGKVRHEI